MASFQSIHTSTDQPLSQASQLPHLYRGTANYQWEQVCLLPHLLPRRSSGLGASLVTQGFHLIVIALRTMILALNQVTNTD